MTPIDSGTSCPRSAAAAMTSMASTSLRAKNASKPSDRASDSWVGSASASVDRSMIRAFPLSPAASMAWRYPRRRAAPDGRDEALIWAMRVRLEEHTSELQSRFDLVCRLLLEKKKRH